MSSHSRSLQDQLLDFLSRHDESGVADPTLREHFGAKYEQLVTGINELLQSNRLQLYYQGSTLIYKLVNENTAAKLEGLGGIWTRDIKSVTNIPQHQLVKTLKTLEQRNLIKSVRSVTSKSKKLYMLFDAVPAKDITGGPWYTDQEFDHDFINGLNNFIVQLVQNHPLSISAKDISDRVRSSGISKVDLSLEELELVLCTLVYDGKIEEVTSSVAAMMGKPSSVVHYKISNQVESANYLTNMPCGKCPVIDRCCVGGLISPTTCQYMKDWLEMEPDIEDL